MKQLRLVWSCKNFETLSLGTKKKPAKCERPRIASSRSRSLLKRFEKLQSANPTAAAVIEKWVDQALADLKVV